MMEEENELYEVVSMDAVEEEGVERILGKARIIIIYRLPQNFFLLYYYRTLDFQA